MSVNNNRLILLKKSSVVMSKPPLVIGRGAMGEVYLASYKGEPVVVKSQRDIIDTTLLQESVHYFKLQNHNNILKFRGVIRNDRYSFSLVLEYAPNGNLSSYLSTHTLEWVHKAKICRGITLGLMHCHDNNVIHFDLKPENILLGQDLTPKLADFGISKTRSQMILDNGKAGGTLNYVAPERVCRDPKMREFFDNHPKLSDIYSFGLILWSVAKDGEHPYEGMDDEYIRDQKKSAHSIHRLMNQLPEGTPPNFYQVIFDLTKYNPGERLDLTIALIELESLFEDEEDGRVESYYYGDSLRVHDDDDYDVEIREDSVAGSEPVSTSTTIESEKTCGCSERSTESCEIISDSSRSSVISRASGSSEHNKCNANLPHGLILNRSIVASPVPSPAPSPTPYPTPYPAPNVNRRSIGIELPSIPSLNTLIFGGLTNNTNSNNNRTNSTNSNNNRTNSINSNNNGHCKHDSGVGIDSPLLNTELELIGEAIDICDHWEEFKDELMRRKLEVLCHEKKIEPKNLLEIFERYRLKTANHYFVIGFMNEQAFGKEQDPRMAFEYYLKAAESGDSRGLVYSGWCFYKGMGTSKDTQKAFNYFQRAASNGCASAYNNIGWCHDTGFGTSTDPYRAFECYKSSAERGNTTAQCRVGVCYEYGRGTTKDLDKALEWYTKAADNGHETARRRVSELSKQIRPGRKRNFLSSFINLFHN